MKNLKKDNLFLAYLHFIGFSQKNLLAIFGEKSNYKEFFEGLSFESLAKLNIFKDDKIFEIMANHKKTNYSKLDEIIGKNQINIISYNDEEYPNSLKNIANIPFILYTKGNIDNLKNLISIVGSRKSSKYSEVVLKKIIPDLVSYNFGIVSGGAYGVDSLAHKITLDNGGYTISVIGTGIDKIYPATNKSLYDEIISKNGLIISIFRLSTGPDNYNFPIRNEIISGLSLGTLVVEAGEKSGTLITAKLALDQGRDVFAIPGDITRENSIGANNLIKEGSAKLVVNSEDILEEYNIKSLGEAKKRSIEIEDEIEKLIFNLIQKESLTIDQISEILNLPIEIVSMKISIMEINSILSTDNTGAYFLN